MMLCPGEWLQRTDVHRAPSESVAGYVPMNGQSPASWNRATRKDIGLVLMYK